MHIVTLQNIDWLASQQTLPVHTNDVHLLFLSEQLSVYLGHMFDLIHVQYRFSESSFAMISWLFEYNAHINVNPFASEAVYTRNFFSDCMSDSV